MGMYVCASCIEKYHLNVARGFPHITAMCEICLDLRGDEENKPTNFTFDLQRFIPVTEQLAERDL